MRRTPRGDCVPGARRRAFYAGSHLTAILRALLRSLRLHAEGTFHINTVFAGILVLTMFALLVDYAVTRAEERLLVWRPARVEREPT
jgi:hypothetical protein